MRADAPPLVDRAGVGEAQRAARAHGAARAAAHAQVRLDDDAAAAGHRRAGVPAGAGPWRVPCPSSTRRCGWPAPNTRRCRRGSRSARCGCARTAWAGSGRTSASRTRRPLAQLEHGLHQRRPSSPADMEVALRLLVHRERGLRAQVEHQVEAGGIEARRAGEVDRTGGFAHAHTFAVALAGVESAPGRRSRWRFRGRRRCRRCSVCTGPGRSGCRFPIRPRRRRASRAGTSAGRCAPHVHAPAAARHRCHEQADVELVGQHRRRPVRRAGASPITRQRPPER